MPAESLTAFALDLKQDLVAGSVWSADLHAVKVRLALAGLTPVDPKAAVELPPGEDTSDPELTARLVPLAGELIAEINASNLELSGKYAEQLATEVRNLHAEYERKLPDQGQKTDYIRHSDLGLQLRTALRAGHIAMATCLAVDLGIVEERLLARKEIPAPGAAAYEINDAFGRVALLLKDYKSACAYLLKAGGSSGRTSFNHDLWLAQALLKSGFSDEVLFFLKECRPPHSYEWIATLEKSETPDLSADVFSREPILLP